MNTKQRKTLNAIFANPINGNIEWRRIESLLIAIGCQVIEGSGSRVTFILNGQRLDLHRPHPRKEALRYRVKGVRMLLMEEGCLVHEMNYQNYSAKIEYDSVDRIFVGHIIGIRDIVSFHGSTVEELDSAFREAVDHYLEVCEKIGQTPQKSYSSQYINVLRVN